MQGDSKIAQVTINQISTKTEFSIPFSFVNFWLKVDSVNRLKKLSVVLKGLLKGR